MDLFLPKMRDVPKYLLYVVSKIFSLPKKRLDGDVYVLSLRKRSFSLKIHFWVSNSLLIENEIANAPSYSPFQFLSKFPRKKPW